jgi:hypothetical protein
MTTMKRSAAVLMVLTLFSLPLSVGAGDQSIPPEANWTPTPPARKTVDAAELTEMLVRKGVLTSVDQRGLMAPQVVPSTKYIREMDRQDASDYITSSD